MYIINLVLFVGIMLGLYLILFVGTLFSMIAIVPLVLFAFIINLIERHL